MILQREGPSVVFENSSDINTLPLSQPTSANELDRHRHVYMGALNVNHNRAASKTKNGITVVTMFAHLAMR